ncbi:phosphoglycerate mutase-like protein [Dendrothele bispora CBS 962.96]|uniref:Phosphoglycerate mutase-like protein n=1 Tax=Dendrothele bispora (strain CBS 962.96) TaxID=1314807 RepID=A0A4S8KNJ4_DENBC|nr:phosphoglycerate mutase-like protein [Dendrothele bispora CBS 962.96]
MSTPQSVKRLHVLRHGQAIHNVQRGWPERDPPLTELGLEQARKVSLTFKPDLVICSPMTRTIQTMYAVLSTLENSGIDIPKEIWPNLREAHDAICNKGVSRAIIAAAYPTLDFSRCNVEWDYEEHSDEAATLRAKEVLDEVRRRPEKDILLVGHRAFLAYLVGDERFLNCELRTYELNDEGKLLLCSRQLLTADT